jgi:hypothetical protein
MTEPPIVVRGDGCMFCCLPLLILLRSVGVGGLALVAAHAP